MLGVPSIVPEVGWGYGHPVSLQQPRGASRSPHLSITHATTRLEGVDLYPNRHTPVNGKLGLS